MDSYRSPRRRNEFLYKAIHLVSPRGLFGSADSPGANAGLAEVIHRGPDEFANNIRIIVYKLPLLEGVSGERLSCHHDAAGNTVVILLLVSRKIVVVPSDIDHRENSVRI